MDSAYTGHAKLIALLTLRAQIASDQGITSKF